MNNHFNSFQFAAILPEPRPVSTLCWQIHHLLTVLVPLLRVWVHCPRASNGLLPRRSNLVGYVQRDARFDRFLLAKQSFPAAFQVAACDGTRGLIELSFPDNHFQQLCRSHSGYPTYRPIGGRPPRFRKPRYRTSPASLGLADASYAQGSEVIRLSLCACCPTKMAMRRQASLHLGSRPLRAPV